MTFSQLPSALVGKRRADLSPGCPLHLLCAYLSPTSEVGVSGGWLGSSHPGACEQMSRPSTEPGDVPPQATGAEKGWREVNPCYALSRQACASHS